MVDSRWQKFRIILRWILRDICSTGNLLQRTCRMPACISLSFTYLQVRAEDEGWEDKHKQTAALISHIYAFHPRYSAALKELQRSSLKLDFTVLTFAKEALCVPEASDIASRRLQNYDELINVPEGTGVNKVRQNLKRNFFISCNSYSSSTNVTDCTEEGLLRNKFLI